MIYPMTDSEVDASARDYYAIVADFAAPRRRRRSLKHMQTLRQSFRRQRRQWQKRGRR